MVHIRNVIKSCIKLLLSENVTSRSNVFDPKNPTVFDNVFTVHDGDEHILEFYFYDANDGVGVQHLHKSKRLSGSQILNLLELAIKCANEISEEKIQYIELEDDSTIMVSEQSLRTCPLSIFRILAKGQSWYNSMGYFQTNYENERKQWDEVRFLTFDSLFSLFRAEEYEKFKHSEISKERDRYIIMCDIFDNLEGKEFFGELNSESNLHDLFDRIHEFITEEWQNKYVININNLTLDFIFRLLYTDNIKNTEDQKLMCYILVEIARLYIEYDAILSRSLFV